VSVWTDIVWPAVGLVAGWVGNSIRYRGERKSQRAKLNHERRALKLERDKLGLASQDSADEKERWQEEADRVQLDKAAALCRGNEREAQQGRAILEGMAAMGSANPRVTELLDQMTKLELGRTVAEIAEAKAAGEDPEVVEVVSSDTLGITDSVQVEVARGSVDDEGEAGGDGDEAAQEDQGDPPTGGGRPDSASR
jgi:hypothetical protein